MTRSTDPSKNVSKNPPKFHDKAVQSNILWLHLNKSGAISRLFYNQHINKVTPHFAFMRRAQNADTHALKQPRLSQNISRLLQFFYWLSHLTCISRLKAKNERKTLIYTQLTNIQVQPNTFSLFLDESL